MDARQAMRGSGGVWAWTACAAAALLIAGAMLSLWMIHRADRQMRETLLQQARLVAQAVDVEQFRALSGSGADLDRPEYQRLKTQFAALKAAHDSCRFVYLMGRNPTGAPFFFVDNEPPDSEDCSPPGQVYEEASEDVRRVFDTGNAAAAGPYTDRWGTWVSALVPINDPRTGDLLTVLGMDVGAQSWQRDTARASVPPVLLTLALVAVLLAGTALSMRRSRLSGAPPWWGPHVEPAAVVAAGLALTLFAAWTANQSERHARNQTFAQVAASRADVVAEALYSLRSTRLEGLAHFFEGSDGVTAAEFQQYTAHLMKDTEVRAWLWAPAVPAAEEADFEAKARAAGLQGFEIWQAAAQGRRVPAAGRDVYYPVLYVAPVAGNEEFLGYELGSEPAHRAALEEAVRTGLSTATGARIPPHDRDGQQSLLVCRPVFDIADSGRLRGLALAEVRLDMLLRSAGQDGAALLGIALLGNGGASEPLASDWYPGATPSVQPSFLCPVLLFGKAFVVTAWAGDEFLRLHGPKAGWLAGLTGLLLTAALSLMLSMILRRRAELERLVTERTLNLREREEQFRMLFETANDAIRVMDVDRIVDCNARAVEMFGYQSKDEIIGKSVLDFCPNEQPDGAPSRERALAMINAALAGEPQQFQWRHLRKDGTPFDSDVSLNSFSSGGKMFVQAVGRDVTERNRERESLLKTQFAMDRASDSIIWVGDDGRLVYVNSAACASMGYTRGELLAMKVFDIDPDFPIQNWEQHKKDLRRLGSMTFESRHRTKDGRTFPVEVTTNYFEFGGEFLACTSDRDISERKRAEEALGKRMMALLQPLDDPEGVAIEDLFNLHDLQRLQDEFACATGVASIITHPDGTPITEPSCFRRLCAEIIRKTEIGRANCYRSDAVLGRAGLDGPTVQPCLSGGLWDAGAGITVGGRHIANWLIGQVRDETMSEEGMRAYARTIGVDEGEFMAAYREVPAMSQARFREVAQVLYTLASQLSASAYHNVQQARFITERKRADEDREKLQAQLSQAQKMESIGRLAGGVAHDFNNMLSVILGHTELALEQLATTDPLRADLLEVRKAAERSTDLTRQLLAFARKQTVAPRVLDLNETVEGMLKMLRRLIGEDIELAWLPGQDAGPVKIDPSQIDQILANLCVNARDAIGNTGKVVIETGAAVFDEAYCAEHGDCAAGAYAMIAVSDNGCGMDKETLGKLFEPFFTTKERGKGTGLGLATVYGIVRQNDGFINVYSEPGHGTTFRIYLPLREGKDGRAVHEGEPAGRVARGRETILLVEDEPAILRLASRMLESLGYTVVSASTPGEAIRLADAHSSEIHLLMTDVVMPEMNGRDLAKNLLSLYPGLKRLFMSGYTANVIAHHGVLDEGVYFIQKPFSSTELAARVREVLDSE